MDGSHKKHSTIKKPGGGKFHRNEVAFLGAPCSYIRDLTGRLNGILGNELRISYIDADHKADDTDPTFQGTLTDKIGHYQLSFHDDNIDQRYRQIFNDQDAVFVNGNHFTAEKQVVIIHPEKEESLSRKLDKLTDVIMVVLSEGSSEVYSFIADHLDGKNIPVVAASDITTISEHIKVCWELSPPVKGLVIAGGKSTRMGMDKSELVYYYKPQWEHLADLMDGLGLDTYISLAPGSDSQGEYPVIEDTFLDLGPYGAILSALRSDPNSAWLTVAIDIPLLDREVLQNLIVNRDAGKMATCFHNPVTAFPEPLITIWEPRAYPRLLDLLSRGFSCPRKALINSDIKELELEDHSVLRNVNTQEDREEVIALIQKSLKGIKG